MLKKFLLSLVFVLMLTAVCFAQTTRQVTLAWDPNPPTDQVAEYIVHYGTESGIYTQTVSAQANTTASVTIPNDGTVYYFVVTAKTVSGLESDYSNEVNTIQPSAPNIKITVIVEVN